MDTASFTGYVAERVASSKENPTEEHIAERNQRVRNPRKLFKDYTRSRTFEDLTYNYESGMLEDLSDLSTRTNMQSALQYSNDKPKQHWTHPVTKHSQPFHLAIRHYTGFVMDAKRDRIYNGCVKVMLESEVSSNTKANAEYASDPCSRLEEMRIEAEFGFCFNVDAEIQEVDFDTKPKRTNSASKKKTVRWRDNFEEIREFTSESDCTKPATKKQKRVEWSDNLEHILESRRQASLPSTFRIRKTSWNRLFGKI